MKATSKTSIISPSLFGVIIISFFMSFFTIKCNHEKVVDVKGIHLVMGQSIDTEDSTIFKQKKGRVIDPNIFAIIAFIAAVAGTGIYFLRIGKKEVATAIIAATGLLSLLALRLQLHDQTQQQNDGPQFEIKAVAQVGFYLATLSYLAIMALNIARIKKRKKE